ncbi:MAG: lysoplasmalogenase [Anaerolineales bacterium]|jgi:uncharacterized membrane protein YhhN
MIQKLLTLLVVVFGGLTIRAEYLGPRLHVYIFKPLTTILILVIAVLVGKSSTSIYKYLIFAGLVFSLAGDVFLMLPSDQFIAGLVSFLIAQILYIAAFTTGKGFSFNWLSAIPFVVYGIVIYIVLSPHLGSMRLPVIVYMLAILTMAWQGWERWITLSEKGALLGFAGAALFVISDSVLALNRFRGEFASARALTLTTYYAAQWLIALSVG